MTPEEKAQEAMDLYSLGCRYAEKGNLSFSFDCFLRAVELMPHVPPYRLNLAITSYRLARPREFLLDVAFLNAQEAARLAPDVLGNWVGLGEVALHCNKFPESIAAYEKGISIDPSHAFAWALLGFAQNKIGQFEAAKNNFEKALELDPELGMAHFLLSCLYYEHNFNPAKIAFHGERAFECQKPAKMALEAMWNSAHGYLIMGEYKKGFTYLEARLRRNATNAGQVIATDRFPKPLWRGTRNHRVLVHSEMGLGDVFIMMRYLPMIKEKFNCEVLFECQKSMLALARHNFPDIQCVEYGHVDNDSFDMQLPMMSLPLIFHTKSYNVPWDGAYIKPEPHKVEEWREKLMLSPSGHNVGICWHAGKQSHSADNHSTSKRKSVPPELIKPILDFPVTCGVHFVSLQVGHDGILPHPGIKDFSDTAAIISLLDTVISVDTAVANLAGAMGVNLWVIDRFDHCWRYSDIRTPWYPTAKCYRQEKFGEWDAPLAAIERDLKRICDKISA